MKVVIFGKNIVRTDLINKLVGKKIDVKVFGRHVFENVTKIEGVELFKGSIFAELDIRKAIKGADAVISVVDAGNEGNDVALSLGTKKIVQEMEAANIKRIIALGGAGVLSISENDTTMWMEMEDFPEQKKIAATEQLKAFETLKASSLQWTYVCPSSIKPGDATGRYNVIQNYPAFGLHSISVGDLADFIVSELENHNFVRSRVSIGN